MASLGSFGVIHTAPAPAEPDTFTWFGESIRVVDEVNEVELIDLMEAAERIEATDQSSMVVMKNGLRLMLAAEDFDKFWKLARDNRQSIEDLSELFSLLMEAVTGRPTQQPSDSSPGRLSTDESSPVVLPSPVSGGRPDLALIQNSGDESKAWLRQQITA